eukprot:CAMPEP_0174256360 /NCGR_PEP_ID=MMETSP0439-20130205/5600_1 /TAXON_ID=0 /ORGANISM="Stereomyxa ramosa, Strain Chinc5" /LENGTH=918 /DNA_ID=CAMNT_0015338937 /DNA_START=8 /DNA_END=2764 /DNA_ORIENTATION=+
MKEEGEDATDSASPQGSPQPRKRRASDFIVGDTLGEGAYAQVLLAEDKITGKQVALKILDKFYIMKEQKAHQVMREKALLESLKHPNLIELFYTFQDAEHLYFVLEYCPHDEIHSHLKRLGCFEFKCAQFYIAELVSVLEYLHKEGVVHRDIKPENLLLDVNFHLKLIDFGTAKRIGVEKTARSDSFVGTAEYVSPELLLKHYSVLGSDLWALGCVVYYFFTGRAPFRGSNDFFTFQRINHRQFTYPQAFPVVVKDLIEKLLTTDHTKRLGCGEGGVEEIKSHPFFEGIDWECLHSCTPPPLCAPESPPIFDHQQEIDEEFLGRKEKEEEEEEEEGVDTEAVSKSVWEKFLFPNSNEEIIEMGIVWRKPNFFSASRKRQLILTNFPRLFYVDREKMVQKGEIPWDNELYVEVKSDTAFEIRLPGRSYPFEAHPSEPERWAKAISSVLNEHKRVKRALSDPSIRRYIYEEEDNDELWTLSQRIRDTEYGFDVRDRKYLFQTYKMCFVGREAVDWFYRNCEQVMTRHEAIALGEQLRLCKIFEDATNPRKPFMDGDNFYRFTQLKRVVIIGGGFGGSAVAKLLQDEFVDVTLVDNKDHFVCVPSYPACVCDPQHMVKIRAKHVNYLSKRVRLVVGTVVRCDLEFVYLEDGQKIPFDYLVVASGSSYKLPISSTENVLVVNPINPMELMNSYENLVQEEYLAVVGAGPVGIEIIGELIHYFPEKKITLVYQGDRILERCCKGAHKNVVNFLSAFPNVSIVCNETVVSTVEDGIVTQKGTKIRAGLVYCCVGFTPNSSFLADNFPDRLNGHGYITVNSFLQVVGPFDCYENVFAIGDVCDIPEEKLAQSAEKHAGVVVKNILALETKSSLSKYSPSNRVLIISLGPKKALLVKGNTVYIEGTIPSKIKSLVESKIMRKVREN